MKLVAKKINRTDFAPYGTYYSMYDAAEGVSHTRGDSYEDHMTRRPLIDTFAHLGLTVGSGAPCRIISMEKHSHTQEAILCMAEPIIFCVAAYHGDAAPRAADLRAFLMEPGDIAVIEREVWHDACHGLGHSASYYWVALAGESAAVWEKLIDDVELNW